MPFLLPDVVNGKDVSKGRLIIVQHDLSQAPFSILREILRAAEHIVLVRAIYPRDAFVNEGDRVTDVDCMSWDPQKPTDVRASIMDTVAQCKAGTTILLDSLDTIAEDVDGPAGAARLVRDVLSISNVSRVVAPVLSPTRVLPLLSAFTPRIELRLHTPALLRHLSRELASPPSSPRFWTLLRELAARREGERLARSGDAGANAHGDVVVELIVPTRRGVSCTLELWRDGKAHDISVLGLESQSKHVAVSNPTEGVSFNLNLTAEQQAARSRVVLPYAHTGEQSGQGRGAEITYDPDSADDFDEEDPDDDLEL